MLSAAAFPMLPLLRPPTAGLSWYRRAALLVLLAMFATWDDAATSLFLGAIVPLHLTAATVILASYPSDRRPAGLAWAQVSLLIPALVSAVG
jgi:hypothetical protein